MALLWNECFQCGTLSPILPFWETYQNQCKQLPVLFWKLKPRILFHEHISKAKKALYDVWKMKNDNIP